MAPEIFEGKFKFESASKADVYALGVLINEFLDEKHPYSGILTDSSKYDDLKNRVIKGEEPGKNRPSLTSGPGVMKDLIKSCWKSDLNARPSLKDIYLQKPWDQAKISSSAASDKNTGQLLELFNAHTKTVRFSQFVKKCSDVLSESSRLFLADDYEGPFDGPYIRTLIVALDLTKGTDNVSEDSVRRLLSWVYKARKNEILDLIYSFFTKDYFFGTMDDNEAKDIISRSPKAGTYLVRWSNAVGSFVIDYIPKKKKGQLEHESVNLQIPSIMDLETTLAKTLSELSLSKESIVGNRPVKLVTLKIKEKFVSSAQSGYLADVGGGPAKADLSSSNTESHYDFIL
jgi:serine/threonine protein kinase